MTLQDRRSYNLMILNHLKDIIETYSDLRFGQIIEIFCKDAESDFFYDESNLIYERLQKRINEYL